MKALLTDEAIARTNGDPNRGSHKVSVMVRGSNKWADNGLRFYTQGDASDYASALKRRWPAVDKVAVVICDDPPNCVFPVPSDRYPVQREWQSWNGEKDVPNG